MNSQLGIQYLAARMQVRFGLTDQDRQILSLTLRGFSLNAAARQLEISRVTSIHVFNNLCIKLEASSREAVFVKALEVATS